MTLATIAHGFVFYAGLTGLSAAIVWGMTHVGALDVPNARSSHSRPIPKGGGVGIVAAFVVGVSALYALGSFREVADPSFPAVVVAASGTAGFAYLDDLFGWPAWTKLVCQITAAAIVVTAGLNPAWIRLPGFGTFPVNLLGPGVTIIWLVAVTNAVNFMDGLNGLASGVVGIACLSLAILSYRLSNGFLGLVSSILFAGILGFLPFNFPSARIFMGDVGSQFCGFLIAVLTWETDEAHLPDLTIVFVPMMLAGLLFDAALTLVRRALAGERLAQAHRSHLYQLAHRSGMSAPAVTLIHWAFAAWGGVCCALVLQSGAAWKPVFVIAVLPPQFAWWWYVDQRAMRAAVPRPILRLQPPPM